LRFYLFILLYQRVATIKVGNKIIAITVTLDIILATYITPANYLADTLKGIK